MLPCSMLSTHAAPSMRQRPILDVFRNVQGQCAEICDAHCFAALAAQLHTAWHHARHSPFLAAAWHVTGICLEATWNVSPSEHILWRLTLATLVTNLIRVADVTGAGGAVHCTVRRAYLHTSRAHRALLGCPRPPGLWTAPCSRKAHLWA